MSKQPKSLPAVDLRQSWDQATEMVKKRVVMPALWRAMEAARPLVLDRYDYVVGFAGVDEALHAHLLQEVRYRNIIEQCLTDITTQMLTLRVISGTTVEEWEEIKTVEAEAAKLRTEVHRRQSPAEGGTLTWDSLSEQLTRRFSDMTGRQMPSTQAEYLDHAVGEIAKAYPNLMAAGEEASETDRRGYSRVLERISDRVGVPAAMIGYLVQQRRRQSGVPESGA